MKNKLFFGLRPPVKIIAKAEDSIILSGKNNETRVFNNECAAGKAFLNTFKTGDVLPLN